MVTYPAFRVLSWLANAAGTSQNPPPDVILAEHVEGAFDELLSLGLIEDTRTNDGSFSFIPTGDGRVAARRARTDYRAELAQRCVLTHLQDGEFASLDGLETSSLADDYDGRLTDREIADAADDLADLSFIEGQRRGDGRFYLAHLTPAGRRALRGPSPLGSSNAASAHSTQHYSTTTTITGDNNQVATSTHGAVSQTMSVDNSTSVAPGYEEIARILHDLLATLPRLPVPEPDQEALRDEAAAVLGEVVSVEPDRRLIKRALNSIRGLLAPLVIGVNQAVTAESAEFARHTIDQITSSGML